MAASIAIVIVMFIINAFMVYAVIRTWERVNDKMEKYFLTKTSEFASKESKPRKQEEEIPAANKEEENVSGNQTIYLADTAVDKTSYKDSDFKENYKAVKENMDFSKKKIISEVVHNEKTKNKETPALDLANAVKFETVYELSTLEPLEQEKLLRSVLTKGQEQILDEYLRESTKKFNSIEFFDYVKQLAKKEDPNFYVKTGWENDDFEKLGDNVVTVHDDDITEGVKIIHKDKLYDYSI